jgi:D-alanyl-D-alanine carboxypeptidase (penicillin-binding protein 5/6)
MKRLLKFACLSLVAALSALPASASSPSGALGACREALEKISRVDARAAVVIDSATGTVLYAKNPDLVIPPASLTKLVTLHVVYNEIAAGRLKKNELVTIDARDCSPAIPYGSTIMYLRPGMKVSVLDLMKGAAVVSGNDAAFALARRVAGSNEAFAFLMNQAMRDMGFPRMHFVEPSGLSELNTITARDYALFCKRYLELHPESIAELHSLHYIEFPRAEHATADYKPRGRMIQYNRNTLVLKYPGCDGLKTGYIIESGYNLAATAKRGDTRFIIVTLGGSESAASGGGAARRSHDGSDLLDWSFANFVTTTPPVFGLEPLHAWYSSAKSVAVKPADNLEVTVPRDIEESVKARVVLPASVNAPLPAGTRVGEVIYSSGDQVLRRVDLVTANEVVKGNAFIVLRDAVTKFFMKLFGKAV